MFRSRDVYPDPIFFYSGSEFSPSRIPYPNFFHPGSRIRLKEIKYFNPKKWFRSTQKYDPGFSSRIPYPDFYPSRIQDPGVKRRHCITVVKDFECLGETLLPTVTAGSPRNFFVVSFFERIFSSSGSPCPLSVGIQMPIQNQNFELFVIVG